jgi:serine phosphatase RsbU (regulator of sigma subunit)/anti-sigma regulatory factor (Ser/Thr protein kinase)
MEIKMVTWLQKSWQSMMGRPESSKQAEVVAKKSSLPAPIQPLDLDLNPSDPLMAYLLSVTGVVEIDRLNLDSPALRKLKQAGVKIAVPLITQGELIGLLNLGPRLSEQDYSSDDRRLLSTLATQAAPALRVAQLVLQQQAETRQRERIEQELRVARVVQQTLLPKIVPDLAGWQIAAHWLPARAVSGDFYDFYPLPDGRLGLVIADVTDKGVPAALVMANTHGILRAAAAQLVSPGKVLDRVNNLLCPDIPPKMFVTCFYAVLDPATGHLQYANAGHPTPYQRTDQGLVELRARGMPLGLFPDMPYDEQETIIAPGDSLIFYSDGLVEAHNPQEEMFGTGRLKTKLAAAECGEKLIECLVDELNHFTGPGWEQEDDVTFVSLDRLHVSKPEGLQGEDQRTLLNISIPSEPGNETQAMEQVARAVQGIGLPQARLEKLKTATAEAVMNAMEHGNHYQADKPVQIEVNVSARKLLVHITDFGSKIDLPELETPDLEAKLDGLDSPRGWGLFLIHNMVDEMNVQQDDIHHTLELVLNLKEVQP